MKEEEWGRWRREERESREDQEIGKGRGRDGEMGEARGSEEREWGGKIEGRWRRGSGEDQKEGDGVDDIGKERGKRVLIR